MDINNLQNIDRPNRSCMISGCDRSRHGGGLCRTHYMRVWRTVNVEPSIPSGQMRTVGSGYKREKSAFYAMHKRCSDPTYKGWHNYGGKGIKVCERWSSFDNFLADMGPHPGKGHSLDRVDSDKDYEPSNCRWATLIEQRRNSKRIHPITFNGETKLITDWAKQSGVHRAIIRSRICRMGWEVGRAIFTPSRGRLPLKSKRPGNEVVR